VATRKRKPAIESGQGHSYYDWAGYDSITGAESVEVSKQLNRRGIPQTSTRNKNSKNADDYRIALDYLISKNEKAEYSYAKHQKNQKKFVPKKNVKRGAK
jgi:hypothetical protein